MNFPSNAPQEQPDERHGLYLIRHGKDALLVDTFPSWSEAAAEALRRTLEGADGSGAAYRVERLEEVESE